MYLLSARKQQKGRAAGGGRACSPARQGNLDSVTKDSTEHKSVGFSPLVGPLKAAHTEVDANLVTPLTDGNTVSDPDQTVLQPRNQSPHWKPATVSSTGLQPVPVTPVPGAKGGAVGSVQQQTCQNLYGLVAAGPPRTPGPAKESPLGTGPLRTKVTIPLTDMPGWRFGNDAHRPPSVASCCSCVSCNTLIRPQLQSPFMRSAYTSRSTFTALHRLLQKQIEQVHATL